MVQDGSFSLDRQRDYLRRLALKAAGPLFPARIVADHGGLQQAEALARSGRGIVLIMNHFSKRDAFQVLRLVYANDVLRRRATLGPVAAHRAGPAVYALANLFSVELCPVVTPEAAALYGVDPATGRHALAYARQAVETLRAGGIVPLAAQAGRRAARA